MSESFVEAEKRRRGGGLLSDALLGRGYSAPFARKGVMVFGALAMFCGILVIYASNAAGAVAWVSVANFGFGLWTANLFALHADFFPPETMATTMGTTLMAASLSSAAFTFGLGQNVDRIGCAPVFWSAAFLPLAACLPLFLVLSSTKSIGDQSGLSTISHSSCTRRATWRERSKTP